MLKCGWGSTKNMNGTSVQGDRFLLIFRAGCWKVSTYTMFTLQRWSQIKIPNPSYACPTNFVSKCRHMYIETSRCNFFFCATQSHMLETGGIWRYTLQTIYSHGWRRCWKTVVSSEVSSALIIILKSEKGKSCAKVKVDFDNGQPSSDNIEKRGKVINRGEKRKFNSAGSWRLGEMRFIEMGEGGTPLITFPYSRTFQVYLRGLCLIHKPCPSKLSGLNGRRLRSQCTTSNVLYNCPWF